jgi:hypothetical protein
MNKTRTLTIINNLLLEVSDAGHIKEMDASSITSIIGKLWRD